MLTSLQFLQGVTLFGLRASPNSQRIPSLLPNSLPFPELGIAVVVPPSLLYFPYNNPPHTHTHTYTLLPFQAEMSVFTKFWEDEGHAHLMSTFLSTQKVHGTDQILLLLLLT